MKRLVLHACRKRKRVSLLNEISSNPTNEESQFMSSTQTFSRHIFNDPSMITDSEAANNDELIFNVLDALTNDVIKSILNLFT